MISYNQDKDDSTYIGNIVSFREGSYFHRNRCKFCHSEECKSRGIVIGYKDSLDNLMIYVFMFCMLKPYYAWSCEVDIVI